jgi:protein-disulfide isomerase
MQLSQRSAQLLRAFVCLAVVAGVISGVSAATAAGMDQDQLIKYYRKKNNVNPATPVAVTDLKEAGIKGAKQGNLEVGAAPQVRKVAFIISEDGRYVVFGDMEDLTVDPFKKVMEKISMKDGHKKGPDNAKVTIVEYSDFQCPFCARGYTTVETQVLKEYGDKVRFVFKNYPLPFHPWAEPGAVASECAGEQKPEFFWKAYSYMFENQKDINAQNVKEKVLGALADTKIDKKKFEDCFDNKKTLDKVKAQMAEGQSVGVNGTPAFIINGRLVSGAQPFEQFKNIIDDELAAAK